MQEGNKQQCDYQIPATSARTGNAQKQLFWQ